MAGAVGLMQVMPAEFQSQGIPEGSWFDPATNILAGSTEIGRFLASTGSIEQALASYFGSGCDAVGTCTDGYIATVLSYAAAYATAIATGAPVDLSGVAVATGTGAVDTGTAGDGAYDDGSWQDTSPDGSGGGWQGGPPSDGDDGWQGDPGDDPNWNDPDGEGDGAIDEGTDLEGPGVGDGETSSEGGEIMDDGEAVG